MERSLRSSYIHLAKVAESGALPVVGFQSQYRRSIGLEGFVDALAGESAVFLTMEDAAQEARARIWGA
jgi:hypothetical protein